MFRHKHSPYVGKRALLFYFRDYTRKGLYGIEISPDTELARCQCCNALIKPPKGFLWFTQSHWPMTAGTGILWILVKCGITSLPIMFSLFMALVLGVYGGIPVAWAYFGC